MYNAKFTFFLERKIPYNGMHFFSVLSYKNIYHQCIQWLSYLFVCCVMILFGQLGFERPKTINITMQGNNWEDYSTFLTYYACAQPDFTEMA